MSDTIPNPLHEIHRQAEAEMQLYGEIEIVSTYGEPQAEYAAIRKACGMMDLPQRAILELTGADRLTFLNNLLTNQTYDKQAKKGLEAGQGVYAFLLNAKTGRIVTDVNVLELGERTWLEMEQRLVEPIRKELDRYLFAERVKIASRVGELHEFSLHGPRARDMIARAADHDLPVIAPHQSVSIKMIGQDVVVWRDDPAGVPGYQLVMPSDNAAALWMHFVTLGGSGDELGKRPLRSVGWAAFNTTRIEAGRAMYGIDFDDSVVPAETGMLKRAVSFTKGCYPGQEIVARMHARGQVAKQIVGIRLEGDTLPIAGAACQDEQGNTIGGITSSTVSPVLSNAAICIGIVKRPHFALGTKLKVPAEGAMREATVVELPFVK